MTRHDIFPMLGLAMSFIMILICSFMYSDELVGTETYVYCAMFWIGIFVLIGAIGLKFEMGVEN